MHWPRCLMRCRASCAGSETLGRGSGITKLLSKLSFASMTFGFLMIYPFSSSTYLRTSSTILVRLWLSRYAQRSRPFARGCRAIQSLRSPYFSADKRLPATFDIMYRFRPALLETMDVVITQEVRRLFCVLISTTQPFSPIDEPGAFSTRRVIIREKLHSLAS